MSRRKPIAVGSVINQLAIFRTGDPDKDMTRGIEVDALVREAREAAQRYRAAVLRHEDLALRLKVLLGLQRVAAWNGYVPPREDANTAGFNPSPYRAQLVEIVWEALTRDSGWTPIDADRLARIPARFIKAPWNEPRREQKTRASEGQALWPQQG